MHLNAYRAGEKIATLPQVIFCSSPFQIINTHKSCLRLRKMYCQYYIMPFNIFKFIFDVFLLVSFFFLFHIRK